MAKTKKIPLQIYLRDDQDRVLRSIAEKRGESIAALVRESVDKLIEGLPPGEDSLWDIVGIYDSGFGNLAEKHDEIIVDSIADENRRGS